jgi:hypothetical protein
MRTIVFDDCYLCNWMMSDGLPKGERWCGAGRPEFEVGSNCPTRSEKVECALVDDVHDSFWMMPESAPVHNWIRDNLPGTKVYKLSENWQDRYTVLEFTSLSAATFFMLNWSHVYHTSRV